MRLSLLALLTVASVVAAGDGEADMRRTDPSNPATSVYAER